MQSQLHFINKRTFTNNSWFDKQIHEITQQLDELKIKEQKLYAQKYGCDDPNCEIHSLGNILKRVSLDGIQQKRKYLMTEQDRLFNNKNNYKI